MAKRAAQSALAGALLRRFAIQNSIAGEGQIKTKQSDQKKKQTGSDERHHHRGHRDDRDRPKEYFAPAPMPKAALAGQHRGRRDEQSDAAKENVDDENRLEDAVHFHPSFSRQRPTGDPMIDPYHEGIYHQIYMSQSK